MDERDADRPPHLDEQTAHDDPEGPGESKAENLRRIRRSLEEQRRREREARSGEEQPPA
ncbi:MAG TPA: hypothetical protein VHL78_08070 [Actinomycetota bacterium]|nr:hypothetical protein [Actinomycetota bacterium]